MARISALSSKPATIEQTLKDFFEAYGEAVPRPEKPVKPLAPIRAELTDKQSESALLSEFYETGEDPTELEGGFGDRVRSLLPDSNIEVLKDALLASAPLTTLFTKSNQKILDNLKSLPQNIQGFLNKEENEEEYVPNTFGLTKDKTDALRVKPYDLTRITGDRQSKIAEDKRIYADKSREYGGKLETYNEELAQWKKELPKINNVLELPDDAFDRFEGIAEMAYKSAAKDLGYGGKGVVVGAEDLKEAFRQKMGDAYPVFEYLKKENSMLKKIKSDYNFNDEKMSVVKRVKRDANRAIAGGQDPNTIMNQFDDFLEKLASQK
jgi:hypothetical protein